MYGAYLRPRSRSGRRERWRKGERRFWTTSCWTTREASTRSKPRREKHLRQSCRTGRDSDNYCSPVSVINMDTYDIRLHRRGVFTAMFIVGPLNHKGVWHAAFLGRKRRFLKNIFRGRAKSDRHVVDQENRILLFGGRLFSVQRRYCDPRRSEKCPRSTETTKHTKRKAEGGEAEEQGNRPHPDHGYMVPDMVPALSRVRAKGAVVKAGNCPHPDHDYEYMVPDMVPALSRDHCCAWCAARQGRSMTLPGRKSR